MAVHDARMMTFGQWWKRSVRAGHALAQRYALNGRSRLHDCRRELVSTLLWGLIVPLATLLLLRPTHGLSMLLLGGYALLGWRVYRYYRRTGVSSSIRSSPRSSCFTPSSRTWSAFSAFVESVAGRYPDHRI